MHAVVQRMLRAICSPSIFHQQDDLDKQIHSSDSAKVVQCHHKAKLSFKFYKEHLDESLSRDYYQRSSIFFCEHAHTATDEYCWGCAPMQFSEMISSLIQANDCRRHFIIILNLFRCCNMVIYSIFYLQSSNLLCKARGSKVSRIPMNIFLISSGIAWVIYNVLE